MGDFKRVNIPATRDPFVNNHLTPAGVDKVTGEERFFLSTWNSNSGCLAVLITPTGKNRIYRFDAGKKQFGFYGASYGGDNIMWLSGFLDEIVRLDLETGETEAWNTGFPHSLSFSGMIYDSKTKKVYSGTYCQNDLTRKAFSFDTVSKMLAARYEDIPAKYNYHKFSLKNIDGTYTLFNNTPDMELMIWNPEKETVEVIPDSFKAEGDGFGYFINREDGAIYIPHYGWFDPLLRKRVDGPKAEHETSWFAFRDNIVYGAEQSSSGNSTLYKWDLNSNSIAKIIEIPDASSSCFALTSSGRIIGINLYGFFYRINPENSAIECSVKLESDSIGNIDCLHRINEERLLCTPFITQRFYEIDLITGEGFDLGRATGGFGEVLKITELDGKIYMASYTSGQLVEYDPACHANFPENPRIVVYPPENALRPVGMCNDGKNIYYSCSHEYGHLGSILIKHTPSEGITQFEDSPIENQMVRSIFYDKKTGSLIAGTTYAADCNSCKPVDNHCMLAKINAETLKIEKLYDAPNNSKEAIVYGKLDEDTYLCRLTGGCKDDVWLRVDARSFNIENFELPKEFCKAFSLYYNDQEGQYVLSDSTGVSLWDLQKGKKIKDICQESGYYRLHLQDNNVYLVYKTELHIYKL